MKFVISALLFLDICGKVPESTVNHKKYKIVFTFLFGLLFFPSDTKIIGKRLGADRHTETAQLCANKCNKVISYMKSSDIDFKSKKGAPRLAFMYLITDFNIVFK
jgi:hypothetical protein